MSYEINVSDYSLVKRLPTEAVDTKPHFIYTDDMYFFEYWEDTSKEIDFNSNFYQSSDIDELLEDLNDFQQMGVRGHFTVYGEQGEWIKYVLDANGVTELNATLLWGDEADIPQNGTLWENIYAFMDKLALAGKGYDYLKYYIKNVDIMIEPYFIGNKHASVVLYLVDSVWFWDN